MKTHGSQKFLVVAFGIFASLLTSNVWADSNSPADSSDTTLFKQSGQSLHDASYILDNMADFCSAKNNHQSPIPADCINGYLKQVTEKINPSAQYYPELKNILSSVQASVKNLCAGGCYDFQKLSDATRGSVSKVSGYSDKSWSKASHLSKADHYDSDIGAEKKAHSTDVSGLKSQIKSLKDQITALKARKNNCSEDNQQSFADKLSSKVDQPIGSDPTNGNGSKVGATQNGE